MNYIKQFNESKKYEKLDFSYLNNIFGEFIDNGSKSQMYHMGYAYHIRIPKEFSYDENIDSFIEYTSKLNQFAIDIKSCIDRVKDEYKNASIYFETESDYVYEITIVNKMK